MVVAQAKLRTFPRQIVLRGPISCEGRRISSGVSCAGYIVSTCLQKDCYLYGAMRGCSRNVLQFLATSFRIVSREQAKLSPISS